MKGLYILLFLSSFFGFANTSEIEPSLPLKVDIKCDESCDFFEEIAKVDNLLSRSSFETPDELIFVHKLDGIEINSISYRVYKNFFKLDLTYETDKRGSSYTLLSNQVCAIDYANCGYVDDPCFHDHTGRCSAERELANKMTALHNQAFIFKVDQSFIDNKQYINTTLVNFLSAALFKKLSSSFSKHVWDDLSNTVESSLAAIFGTFVGDSELGDVDLKVGDYYIILERYSAVVRDGALIRKTAGFERKFFKSSNRKAVAKFVNANRDSGLWLPHETPGGAAGGNVRVFETCQVHYTGTYPNMVPQDVCYYSY